jgi:hypothetical protein
VVSFRVISLTLVGLGLIACGHDFPELGVSVLPPTGPRWWVVPGATFSPNHLIVFGKPLTRKYPETPDELRTLVAQVVVFEISEDDAPGDISTAENLKQRLESGLAAELLKQNRQPLRRFVSVDEQVDRSPGAECLRYDETVEDTRVPRFEGSVFVERQRGFRCLHPYRTRTLVDFGHSERHLSGLPEVADSAEVEPFLTGIRFVPVKR